MFVPAGRAFQVLTEAFSASADPTDLPGGVAHHEGVVRDIPGNHGSRADESVAADGDAAHDGAVGAEGGAVADQGGAHLVHFADFGPWVVDVRENHGGSAKDALFQGDPFIDRNVVLDLATAANAHIRADDYILPDIAALAKTGAAEHV